MTTSTGNKQPAKSTVQCSDVVECGSNVNLTSFQAPPKAAGNGYNWSSGLEKYTVFSEKDFKIMTYTILPVTLSSIN